MFTRYLTLTLTFAILCTFTLTAQSGKKPRIEQYSTHPEFSFRKNLGQLTDEKGQLLSDVKYYGSQAGVYVYIRSGSISFVFTSRECKPNTDQAKLMASLNPMDGDKEVVTKAARMDMQLTGANPDVLFQEEDLRPDLANYYMSHTGEKGITDVQAFGKLRLQNIYPNIDMVLIANKDKGLTYEFEVHPGGNPEIIRMHWSGTQPKLSKDGGLHYENILGKMDEARPLSFQAEGKNIASSFLLKGKDISFAVGIYDKSKTLTIDPTLLWATYYGGTDGDYFRKIISNDSLEMFAAGSASSTGLATSGAFQTSQMGNDDAILTKFESSGNRLWTTYIGGGNNEIINDLVIDSLRNIVICGWSSSAGLATSGAFKTSSISQNAILGKFTSSGKRNWLTYFGGDKFELGEGVASDKAGNLFLVGQAYSPTGVATKGAYDTLLGKNGTYTGQSDGFFAKFSFAGARLWASYYGGDSADLIRAVQIDTKNNIVLFGETKSGVGIATLKSYQRFKLSPTGSDAFLTKFDLNGSRIWGTYYGSSGFEDSKSLKLDTANNIFVTGASSSSTGMTTSGTFRTSNPTSSDDAYLGKFNSSGFLQ